MAKKKNYHGAVALERSSFVPAYFNNQYNDNDYDVFEDQWANTVIGTAIDTKVEFTQGEGVKPKFELKDKTITGDAKVNELKKYDKILESLIEIDDLPHVRLNDHLDDLQRNALVFGRGVLAFEPDWQNLMALKPIHPRDLGRVFVHQLDWSLSSVHAYQKRELIKAEDMIYLVNFENSPRRRSMHYGFSDIQRVVGQSQALRRIMEFDVVEIVESLWAKRAMLTVDQEGMTENEKKSDLGIIRDGLKAGAFNVINAKKDEINFFPLDATPEIAGLMSITEKIEQMIIGNTKVPAPLLGREEEANMATLQGKIRLFIAGPIKQQRRWVEKCLVRQWYERNLQKIDRNILEKVRVTVEFEPIIIESWIDNIDALQKLKQVIPGLPDEEILKLAHLDELTDKIKQMKANGQDNILKDPNVMQTIEDNATTPDLVQKAKEKKQLAKS